MLIFIRQVQAGSKADNSKHNEAFHKLLPTNFRNLSNLFEIPSVQSETCIKYLIWQTTLPRKLQVSLSLSLSISLGWEGPPWMNIFGIHIYTYICIRCCCLFAFFWHQWNFSVRALHFEWILTSWKQTKPISKSNEIAAFVAFVALGVAARLVSSRGEMQRSIVLNVKHHWMLAHTPNIHTRTHTQSEASWK